VPELLAGNVVCAKLGDQDRLEPDGAGRLDVELTERILSFQGAGRGLFCRIMPVPPVGLARPLHALAGAPPVLLPVAVSAEEYGNDWHHIRLFA
jgi:hypothetical protein